MSDQCPSFRQFYEEMESPLYNTALRWCANDSLAMEFVHDAMIELWQRHKDLSANKWRSYVFKVLLNKMRNSYRSKQVWQRVKALFLSESGQAQWQDPVLDKEVLQALDTLSEAHKTTLVLTEVVGLTYVEVAEVMEVPEGTVGSRRNAALAELRTRWMDV
jgi:RNA polymerase sigma-70 factor, ECF subfamily